MRKSAVSSITYGKDQLSDRSIIWHKKYIIWVWEYGKSGQDWDSGDRRDRRVRIIIIFLIYNGKYAKTGREWERGDRREMSVMISIFFSYLLSNMENPDENERGDRWDRRVMIAMILSYWAGQYSCLDTLNSKIHPLVMILWPPFNFWKKEYKLWLTHWLTGIQMV